MWSEDDGEVLFLIDAVLVEVKEHLRPGSRGYSCADHARHFWETLKKLRPFGSQTAVDGVSTIYGNAIGFPLKCRCTGARRAWRGEGRAQMTRWDGGIAGYCGTEADFTIGGRVIHSLGRVTQICGNRASRVWVWLIEVEVGHRSRDGKSLRADVGRKFRRCVSWEVM